MSAYIHPCLVDDGGNTAMYSPAERAIYNTQQQQQQQQQINQQFQQKPSNYSNGYGQTGNETLRHTQQDYGQNIAANGSSSYTIPIQRVDKSFRSDSNENESAGHLTFLYDKAQGGEYALNGQNGQNFAQTNSARDPEYQGFGSRANPAPAVTAAHGISADKQHKVGNVTDLLGTEYRKPPSSHSNGNHSDLVHQKPMESNAGKSDDQCKIGIRVNTLRTRTPSPSRTWDGSKVPCMDFGTSYGRNQVSNASGDSQQPPLPPLSTHPLMNGSHPTPSKTSNNVFHSGDFCSGYPAEPQRNVSTMENGNFPSRSRQSSGGCGNFVEQQEGLMSPGGNIGLQGGASRRLNLRDRSPSPDILKQRTLDELSEKLAQAQVSRQIHRQANDQSVNQPVDHSLMSSTKTNNPTATGSNDKSFLVIPHDRNQERSYSSSSSDDVFTKGQSVQVQGQTRVPENQDKQILSAGQQMNSSQPSSKLFNRSASRENLYERQKIFQPIRSQPQGLIQGQGQDVGQGLAVNQESLRNYETWKAAVNQRKMSLPGYVDSRMQRFQRQVPPTELPKPVKKPAMAELDASSIRHQLREDDIMVEDYDQESIRYKGKANPSKTFKNLLGVTNVNESDIVNQHLHAKPPARRRVRKEEQEEGQKPDGSADDIVDISYVGGKIPSKTFRQLQEAMGEDDYSIWSSPYDRAPSNPARHVKVVHLRRHSVDNIL